MSPVTFFFLTHVFERPMVPRNMNYMSQIKKITILKSLYRGILGFLNHCALLWFSSSYTGISKISFLTKKVSQYNVPVHLEITMDTNVIYNIVCRPRSNTETEENLKGMNSC